VFSKEKAIQCFIIAASYIGARSMVVGSFTPSDVDDLPTTMLTASGPCLNPAIALASILINLISSNATPLANIWLYCGIPFGGAIVAILFYEFVFKKTQEVLEESQTEEDPDSLLDK
jgi:TRAP-type C4-dicarboxylate transport system permease small subunit